MLPGNVPKAREHEMTAPAVRPIIVVGMNRSGTKWLSNIIARHRDVIAVQSPRTNGIVETNMFGPLPDKFDLSSPDEYIGLVELWAATHFFRCTGVDKELFYGLRPRPTSGLQLFDVLMSAYAVLVAEDQPAQRGKSGCALQAGAHRGNQAGADGHGALDARAASLVRQAQSFQGRMELRLPAKAAEPAVPAISGRRNGLRPPPGRSRR